LEELARLADEQPEVESRYNQMRENGMLASKRRYRDLEPKYLACDPLPSPYDERDLTSFITQWREQVDSDLVKAANNCQIAENVIREMQNIQGEAMAMFDLGKLEWCKDYTNQLRMIETKKLDDITAHILMYMEKHTTLTKEEIEKAAEKTKTRGKGDPS
jgi:hypothetical protein